MLNGSLHDGPCTQGMTHPLADVGHESLEPMRRYEVAHVHRRSAGVGVPSAYLQADFDIVGPGSASVTERTLADAEVLKVRAARLWYSSQVTMCHLAVVTHCTGTDTV